MVATVGTYQEAMRQMNEVDEKAAKLMQEWGDNLSREQIDQIKALNNDAKEYESQALQFKEGDDLRQQVEGRRKAARTPVDTIGHGTPGDVPGLGKERKASLFAPGQTFGDYFVENADVKGWREALTMLGNVSEKTRIQSPVVPLHTSFKDLITGLSDTSGGALVRTQYEALTAFPFRPLTIRDLITNGTTGTDTVEYPRITGYTNAAAPVAEATAASGATGAKPESAMALEKVTTAVKTIAHWLPITKRALADAGQLRTFINSFLLQGLEEELEDQIIAGSGVGENFTGILSTTGTLTQAYDTSLLITIRKARTHLRVTGRAQPTGIVLHPNDWEDIDLLKDNEARYYFGGPMVLGTPRLWGVPVVESEAATEGVGLLGDFRKAVLWDREQAGIQVTDSHSDFFIRNLVAMLAEMRAAFGVLQPSAFVEIDLVP